MIDGRGKFDSEIIDEILENRGIKDVDAFFHPSKDDLIDPFSMQNMDKAVDILLEAKAKDSDIGILWDTDTDGLTSGCILTQYLEKLDINPLIAIDTGKKHGLNQDEAYWDEFKKLDVLFIVDSLDSTTNNYRELNDSNVRVVVLDHHDIDPNQPYDLYVTLVSSMRNDYANHDLSGAGVTWKFCKAVDDRIHKSYADDFVDLAATGILADVMDVTNSENRYIINEGLNNLVNPLLKRLTKGYSFNSDSVLYSVSPMVNSANRLAKNSIIMDAFLCTDNKKLLSYNKRLKVLKKEQDNEVGNIISRVIDDCEKQKNDSCIIVITELKYGVAGLVAMKLTSQYHIPVIVLQRENDEYTGSLRTENINLSSIINQSGLAESHGHEQAAGVVVKASNLKAFIEYMKGLTFNGVVHTEDEADVILDVDTMDVRLASKFDSINFINGKNFKPVKAYFPDVECDSIKYWKDGKHMIIQSGNVLFIKWNCTYDHERFEDTVMLGEPISFVGKPQKANFGAPIWVICDEIKIGE